MKTLLSASLVLVQMNHKEDLQVIREDLVKQSFAQRTSWIASNLELPCDENNLCHLFQFKCSVPQSEISGDLIEAINTFQGDSGRDDPL